MPSLAVAVPEEASVHKSSPKTEDKNITKCVLSTKESSVPLSAPHDTSTANKGVSLTHNLPKQSTLNAYYIRSDFTIWGRKDNDVVLTNAMSFNKHQGGLLVNYFEMNANKTRQNIAFSSGARRLLTTANAGGSSEFSEALSFEILSFMTRAVLKCTEMEISYRPGSKITDYSVKVFGKNIGVSVTRAMKYSKNNKARFTHSDAHRLLSKKLTGVVESTRNCLSETWEKQILHIWTQDEYIAPILRDCYNELDDSIKGNTLVVCTVCKDAPWLFGTFRQSSA